MNTQARKRFDKLSSKGKPIPPYKNYSNLIEDMAVKHSIDCASVKTYDIPEYAISPETKFYCNCGAEERWETTIPKLEQRCERAVEIINNLRPIFTAMFRASIDKDLCIVNIEINGWPETEFSMSPTESVEETIDENNDVTAPAWNLYIDDDKQGSPMTLGCALAHLYQWDKTQSIQGECLMLSENTPNA